MSHWVTVKRSAWTARHAGLWVHCSSRFGALVWRSIFIHNVAGRGVGEAFFAAR
jgi:hypothetical protein